MATAEAILLTLCIFVFIPLLLGLTIETAVTTANRKKRTGETSEKTPGLSFEKERKGKLL